MHHPFQTQSTKGIAKLYLNSQLIILLACSRSSNSPPPPLSLSLSLSVSGSAWGSSSFVTGGGGLSASLGFLSGWQIMWGGGGGGGEGGGGGGGKSPDRLPHGNLTSSSRPFPPPPLNFCVIVFATGWTGITEGLKVKPTREVLWLRVSPHFSLLIGLSTLNILKL